MHMLYASIPLEVLQNLMRHKSISSTEMCIPRDLRSMWLQDTGCSFRCRVLMH
ncbi:hypothetical protein VQ090_004401 [Enterobacter ludwigii]|nr:hypothetical protein [Enterobacter ludwigii]HDS4679294.1 hypothetical protein [Enterobacter ludwigii]